VPPVLLGGRRRRALAVAGAIGMILELEKGFGGLIHVSPQPMRQAVDESEAQLHE